VSGVHSDPVAGVRTLPRPKPEHVRGLALDLQSARNLYATGRELDRLAADATLVCLQNAMTNLAAALESRGSVR
jgi:hypothetical protein